jgi:cellulose synthase/poly-beta-1,6-N-acetylglucosamine synthase-like glycosyltransferase
VGVGAFTIATFALLGILAIPILVFVVQVSVPRRNVSDALRPSAVGRPPIAVLMPAHNESSAISSSCETLLGLLREGDRLVVVADNCTDDTADRARETGAEVIERSDAKRIGKGYALDFGIRHLERAAPAALIIVDADCELGPRAIDRLTESCLAHGRPVQAVYIMQNHTNASLRMRIAEFAGIVKNHARPLGLHRLGLPCMLMGTGMAFPWDVIARANLASGHLVEDMKLGIDLAISGVPPMLCPTAEVRSYFPETARGFDVQRTRWEHGHIGVIVQETPRLVAAAFRRKDWRLLAMALDLAVPPLALLVLLLTFSMALGAGAVIWEGNASPLWSASGLAVLLAAAVSIAWARFGRSAVSARDLLLSPAYAAAKLPLYLRYLFRRQTTWVRSERKKE